MVFHKHVVRHNFVALNELIKKVTIMRNKEFIRKALFLVLSLFILVKAGAQPVATAVIGTVKGDLHDIGKNLVCMMIEGAGFAVIDAGVDVSAEKFVELARQHNAQIIGVSALLTTTMPGMKSVVEAVRGAGLGAKVIIGGAPVTQAFCDSIGADGYSADAASAAELARSLIA
jgi:5-methyltetrahydrofolate--homocysteine methyltransferase